MLVYIAAVATTLSGIVPELRAQTSRSGGAARKASPLAPPSVAILFSSLTTDADVRRLLMEFGPNVMIGAPKYSYDLRENGRLIAAPVRNVEGMIKGYIYHGLTAGISENGRRFQNTVNLSVLSTGRLIVAQAGQILAPPPDAKEAAELLHAALFPEEFIDAKARPFAQKQAGDGPDGGMPVHIQKKICRDEFAVCMTGSNIAEEEGLAWAVVAACCLATIAATGLTLGAALPAAMAACSFAGFAASAQNVFGSAPEIKKECIEEFWRCMEQVPPDADNAIPQPRGVPRPAEGIERRPIGGPGEPDVNL